MFRNLVLLLTSFCWCALPLNAQSITDLATKGREKKKGTNQSKPITEKDLKSSGGKVSETRNVVDKENKVTEAARPTSSSNMDKATDLNGKNESYWRTRKSKLKEELASIEREFKEKDSWLAQNHARYTLESLAPYKDERDRLQQKIEAKKQELKDLEDEARRAGAPAGWLRDN